MAYYHNRNYNRDRYGQRNVRRPTPTPNRVTDPTTLRWQKLLKYYRSCIAIENSGEVKLQSSGAGVEYLCIPKAEKEWIASGIEELRFTKHNKHFDNFFKGSRWRSQGAISYSYGFPCYVEESLRRTREGAYEKIIQPVLIFGVDLITTAAGYNFVLHPDKPRINSSFLAHRGLLTSLEARKQVAEAILESWDEEQSRLENLRITLRVLSEHLPPSIDFSDDIFSGKTAGLENADGVVPLGVILRNASSRYTAGLEGELKKLEGLSTQPNSVWRCILNRDAKINKDNQESVVAITELNDEQGSAVQSALSNVMTVVTGPPGTGKSQVVLNIVANALVRGESVLFGSKNHKAVDVVIERLGRIQSEPIILKCGQRGQMSNEIEFVEELLSAINRASTYDIQVLESEIREYKEELAFNSNRKKEAQHSLIQILNRRNRISQLDGQLESLKEELPLSISRNLSLYKMVKVEPEFFKTIESLVSSMRTIDATPKIILRILSIFGFNLERRVLEMSKSLLNLTPVEGITVSPNSVDSCRELLSVCQTLKRWFNHQKELLQHVQDSENEARVDVLRKRITKSKERTVEVSVKYVDVLMRRRLKKVNPSQRAIIADYLSIARRLARDVMGGQYIERLSNQRQEMFKKIVGVFPAIAVTNLSVRNALPLSQGVIDLAIIDEASQCDIASAIPLIYRAKRAVIVGDEQQLAHISPLNSADDQQLQSKIGLEASDDLRFLYSANSLFDLAYGVILNGAEFIHLIEHYRSRAEIIGFSNRRFYHDILKVWTDYRKLRGSGYHTALAWHNVTGTAVRPSSGGAQNIKEAQEVVKLMEEIIARISEQGDDSQVSLGVVTPFRAQANKIRALAEDRIKQTWLRKLDFTADTAHKYQGDERDIMIFSPVVSPGIKDTAIGFLSSTKNLFNVAITRARAELHVVGNKVACAQSGIQHLADFVKYVEEQEPDNDFNGAGKFESPWETVLHKALEHEGIKTISQYGFNQYRLDLAIPDAEIDIEIDGEAWHREINGSRLFSDLKRDQHLESRGWRVKRFWVYELRNDLDRCVREIKEMLE